jgi:hypothetical protein
MQKSLIKILYILGTIKRQISDKKIHISQNIMYFNETFLHTLLLYISIYIFNIIIFRDIKV